MSNTICVSCALMCSIKPSIDLVWPSSKRLFFATALIFIVTMQTTRKCETASQILNDSKSVTGYGCKDVTFELIQQQKLTGKYYSPSFPTLHVGCMFTRLCYSGGCSGFTTGRGTHVCQLVRRNSSQYDEVQRIPHFCVHSNAQTFVYTHCGHDCHGDLGVLMISLTDFFPLCWMIVQHNSLMAPHAIT